MKKKIFGKTFPRKKFDITKYVGKVFPFFFPVFEI
jgi:hypothetical protein